MTAAAWILDNKDALFYVALGVLILVAKIPFVEHSPILEAIVQAALGQTQKEVTKPPTTPPPAA